MYKAKQSEKLKGNTNAKKGEHASIVVRLPVALVDNLHKCIALEGEMTIDKSRIAEYAIDMLEKCTVAKINQAE